jgi:hypothetical protein
MSVKLLPKHILLLLSNQVVQICDDIFKFQSNASNVDISKRGPAAAQFAWVSLQAQHCMAGYLKEKFRHHQALNSMFIRFLTRHMADQSEIGLKMSVDHLKKEVGELKGGKATVSLITFNKLDSKVSALIRLNNLKTRK